MRKQYRLAKVGLGVAAVSLLVLGGGTAASAATNYAISSSVNCHGSLNQYDTYRDHASGSATFKLEHKDFPDSFRIGLRKDGVSGQYTDSLNFASDGGAAKTFTRACNGSTTLPTGTYAVNARAPEGTASCFWTGWNGILRL